MIKSLKALLATRDVGVSPAMPQKRQIRRLAALILIILVLAGCRRPLEVYYWDHALVKIEVDWMAKYGVTPGGMTLFLYDGDGNLVRAYPPTNDVNVAYLELTKAGKYKYTIISKSISEYEEQGTMRFFDITSWSLFASRATEAVNRSRNRTKAEGDYSSMVDFNYMQPPEQFAAVTDSFELTEEMLEESLHFIDYRDDAERVTNICLTRHVEPEKMVTNIHTQIRVGGIDNASGCTAALEGPAEGCYISRVWRTDESGTLNLNGWRGLPTRAENGDGWICCDISSFGLPNGLEPDAARTEESLKLTLCFTLRDGTTRTFKYKVGKTDSARGLQVYYDGYDGISKPTKDDVRRNIYLIIDIPDYPILPDVTDDQKGAGFDAIVLDWDDGGVIDMGTF